MPVIKVEDIAHVRFAAPDLPMMRGFLEDFGLACFEEGGKLYGKSSDGRPFVHVTEPGEARFLAVGLRAAGVADLARLAAQEGVAVEPFGEPGGGMVVRLTDPDGYRVEVVAGQAAEPPAPCAAPQFNSAADKPRQRQTIRLEPAPANVRRIGHAVLKVSDFRVSEAWWKERFGFLTSDEIEAAPDVPLGAFMRCDRGEKPADHHTLFLLGTGAPKFNHAAFEVMDMDDLMSGHDLLKEKSYRHQWGIGRHILGSQIFDYWRDPWGHTLEHWTDGDLMTASWGSRDATPMDLMGVQWGMKMPADMGE